MRYRDWSRLLSRGHELADRIAAICSDKLAEDLVILDMEDVVGYTDAFVICSGQNARHVQAIAEEVELTLKRDEGLLPKGGEGRREGDWILLDYLDACCTCSRPRRARSTASSSCGARSRSARSSDRGAGGTLVDSASAGP